MWKCPDCGTKISASRLKELNAQRKKKGITMSAIPQRCHGKKYRGKHYHIPGVAAKFYRLTPKVEEVLTKLEFALLKKGV